MLQLAGSVSCSGYPLKDLLRFFPNGAELAILRCTKLVGTHGVCWFSCVSEFLRYEEFSRIIILPLF